VDERQEKLQWLKHALLETGLKASPFAEKAGVAPATLTKFLKTPDSITPPSDRIMKTLAEAHDLSGYGYDGQPPETGFKEEGSHPLSPSDVGEEEYERLKKLIGNIESSTSEGAENFHVIEGNGLENLHIKHGDIVYIDHNRLPKENDIVCLSLRDEENFTAKTIFRLYVPSGSVTACITATNDPTISNKVIFVDGINVKIYGVVEKIVRNL
jgi:transcriptional regulator with XRE-family HTH domain